MFRKKKEKSQPFVPPPCKHKHQKDFPWYIEELYSGFDNSFGRTLVIKEPYVCIDCKRRENVELLRINVKTKDVDSKTEELMEEYPQIKPAAEVEDMVNDFIRVDEEYLKFMNLVIAANIPKIEVKNKQEL